MLIDPNGKRKDNLPHEPQFRARRAHLSDPEYDAIVTQINAYCVSHETVSCANISHGNWTDAPWASILRGCEDDEEEAEMFFGQILWLTLQTRPEEWWFFRPMSVAGEIRGMVYTRR